MAIRWSKKGKRFYDDQTGYAVTKTRGFRSSIGRATYAAVHRKRLVLKSKRPKVVKSHRQSRERTKIPKGYEVRPLEEEFREELAQFDGELPKGMSFTDYMEFLDEEQDEAMESDDQYSED
jgi:hypothetical protein